MRTATIALIAALSLGGLALPITLDASHDYPARYAVAIPAQAAPDTQAAETPMVMSDLEDTLGVHYQHDAGKSGDAPDTCSEVDRDRELVIEGELMTAMLLENDDEADVFGVPIGSEYVGETAVYDLELSLGASLTELAFDIVDAACEQSVFDPDADMYHPERTTPGATDPFDEVEGSETYDMDISDSYGCGDQWKFQLKHKGGMLPSALYVEWSNGDYAYVANDDDDPSQVAKYTTTHNTQHTLERVMTQMPSGWDGELSILTGVCGAEEYEAEAPLRYEDGSGGEFPIVAAGEYVLIVTLEEGAVDGATGPSLFKGCHNTGFCTDAFGELSYNNDLRLKDTSSAE